MKRIGQKFIFKGETLITTEHYTDDCDGCFFNNDNGTCNDERFNCINDQRADRKNVIFKIFKFRFGR